MKLVIFALFLNILAYGSAEEINQWPIVGVLAQEIPNHYLPHFPAYSNFIASSYVKAVESSGARVVPVVINKPESYYRNLLKSINGLVLPGGSAKNGLAYPYYNSVRTVYKIAKEINDNGTYFPILGVCLGFEFLITAANNDDNLLKNCSIFYDNYPIKFTDSYSKSLLFSRLSPDQAQTLQFENSTMNYHVWCAYGNDFVNSSLNNEWKITSTTTSNKGVEFIASVEHIKYPFLGVQFHPEKPAFEWDPTNNIPRGEKIVIANRYFYDQLVHLAKFNNQTFADPYQELTHLIYHYPARYSNHVTSYTEVYLF